MACKRLNKFWRILLINIYFFFGLLFNAFSREKDVAYPDSTHAGKIEPAHELRLLVSNIDALIHQMSHTQGRLVIINCYKEVYFVYYNNGRRINDLTIDQLDSLLTISNALEQHPVFSKSMKKILSAKSTSDTEILKIYAGFNKLRMRIRTISFHSNNMVEQADQLFAGFPDFDN